MKLHKGDQIIVTAGKDRGRTGQVERVFQEQDLVLIPGLNEYKRHRKPQGENRPGEIVTLSRPMPVGNIALVCPKCKQPTRIGFRLDSEKKIRVCRKCDNDLTVAKAPVEKSAKKGKK